MSEMASTLQHSERLSFTERAGGWVLAACLHVILFASLVIIKPMAAPEPAVSPQEPIQITFAPDSPAPETEAASEPAGSVTAAAAMQADENSQSEPAITLIDGEESTSAGPLAGTGAPAEAKADAVDSAVESFLSKNYLAEAQTSADLTPETTEDPNDPPAEDDPAQSPEVASLIGTLRERSNEMNRQNQIARAEGSKEVAGRIMGSRATQTANKTLFASNPMHTGVTRTIETANVRNKIADEVLKRWGFRTQVMNINGKQRFSSGYLSGADTAAGSFVNATAESGVYRVLLFSDDTVRRLVQLENHEMQRRKYDPEKVRLTRVVFGVVPAGSGYDLAITRMDVEPIPVATAAEER